MKNIQDLRESLTRLYEDLRTGQCDVKVGAEMNNTAGKIINSLKVELDYSALRKVQPSIAFLDGGQG